jgi:hypothetical protein
VYIADFLEVGTDDEALAIEVLQRREDMLKGNHDDHDDDSIIDDIAPTFALVLLLGSNTIWPSHLIIATTSRYTGAEQDATVLRQQGQG